MGDAYGRHGRQERCTHGFGGGHMRERNNLEDLGVDGRILLKLIFKKCDEEAWTGLISLSMEACGESLGML